MWYTKFPHDCWTWCSCRCWTFSRRAAGHSYRPLWALSWLFFLFAACCSSPPWAGIIGATACSDSEDVDESSDSESEESESETNSGRSDGLSVDNGPGCLWTPMSSFCGGNEVALLSGVIETQRVSASQRAFDSEEKWIISKSNVWMYEYHLETIGSFVRNIQNNTLESTIK